MKRAFTLGVVGLGLLLVGCTPKPSLVGKWKGDVTKEGISLPAEFEFTDGGKMVTTLAIQGVTIAINGNYTYAGDTVTATFESVNITGQVDPVRKAAAEAMFEKEKGRQESTKVVFKDADTIEATSQGQTATWTRVK